MHIDLTLVEKRILGRTGEKVSIIGLGTYGILDYDKAMETFIEAVQNGIDFIDTAEIYDTGRAERFVGEVVRRVDRENVFITTKLPPERFLSSDKALKATKKSLRRLGLTNVDLLLIHWPHPVFPVEVLIRNLEAVANTGLTRYVGVSNFDSKQFIRALNALKKHELVADQVKYSVMDRWVEPNLLPLTLEKSVSIQAYTPLERCSVSRNSFLKRFSKKTFHTSVQVALNYLISNPNVFVVVKTERKNHLREILGAMGWRLSQDDLKIIKENV